MLGGSLCDLVAGTHLSYVRHVICNICSVVRSVASSLVVCVGRWLYVYVILDMSCVGRMSCAGCMSCVGRMSCAGCMSCAGRMSCVVCHT
jgi:hypothetical protein